MIRKSALIFTIFSIIGLGITPYLANSQNISPKQAYKKAVAYCNSGQPGIDVKNCLRDAGAALQQSRHSSNNSTNNNFENNQLVRCENLVGVQHDDCIALMSQSDVTIRGSVEGGGILRERTVIIPAE